tara:strand:+ start:531 stop:1418 length:888 start_codon:yes stop_codon:yes gene_type:complete
MNTNNPVSHRNKEPERGVLYIVGTPIGNLEDISLRSSNILKKVSLIACEDTRTTGKLLKNISISNKLTSFHKYSSKDKLDYLISKLKKGDSIALVSDAGMPLISDPGNQLVRETRNNNLDVICIPGPCAAITALVCSGIDSRQFTFFGFIPKSSKERASTLKLIFENQFTSIIYESPKRIIKLLNDLKDLCGIERDIVVMKEITKRYEQHFGFKMEEVIKELEGKELKGEFTLLISGNRKTQNEDEFKKQYLRDDLLKLIQAGLSHSAAANYLSSKSGLSKNKIYNLILDNDLKY